MITVRHLLSHTSGLPDWLDDRPKGSLGLFYRGLNEPDRRITVQETVQWVRDALTPHFIPQDLKSSRIPARYSDTNFQLLMAIIAQLTGKSLYDTFVELIYKPLDLRHTYHPGHAPLHRTPEPAAFWAGDAIFDKPLLMQSFRDLYSTPGNLIGFMRGLISGTLFDNPATAKLMQQSWRRFGFPKDAASFRAPNWPIESGLGMMQFALPRVFTPFRGIPAVVGHTGVNGAWLFYCPDRDLYLAGTVGQVNAAAVPYQVVVPQILVLF